MNELQNRLINFSVQTLSIVGNIYDQAYLRPIASQLTRSAGSIGANYSEAQSASSRKDFHNKVRIALKEARESEYWLIILKSKLINNLEIQPLIEEATTIIKILTVIARKTDPNQSHN